MTLKEFTDITLDLWNKYLLQTSEQIQRNLIDRRNKTPLYPTILLITETDKCFIAELIGANPKFNKLSLKIHTEKSFERYFSQFQPDDTNPLIQLGVENTFRNLGFAREYDAQNSRKRFPIVTMLPSKLVIDKPGGSLLRFDQNSNFLTLCNCLFINSYESLIRTKHILDLVAVKKDELRSKYSNWLSQRLTDDENVRGVNFTESNQSADIITASQFANTFLTKKLRETTIGEFLRTHPRIIKRALKCNRFVYEPTLPWIEKSPENKDKAINPDLFCQRSDDYYDIYDLKTALLDKNLTKGERRRRRFVDYVEEGVSQLANYAEYFEYKANCEFAFSKYNIKVSVPNLVLIVGYHDNAHHEEILEACRKLKNISIIDYDSLIQMFLYSN